MQPSSTVESARKTYDHRGIEEKVAGENKRAQDGDAEREGLAAYADETESEICDGSNDEDAKSGEEESAEEVKVSLGDHDIGRNRDKNDGGADEGLENDDSRAAREIGGHDDCDEDSVGEGEDNEKGEVDWVLGLEAEERDDAGQGHAQGYVDEPCVGREVVARGVDIRAKRGETDREQELEGQNLLGVMVGDVSVHGRNSFAVQNMVTWRRGRRAGQAHVRCRLCG
jgi:hypothetical protein